MSPRFNAPKRATCPKGVSHQTFLRDVDVSGSCSEVLDDQLRAVGLQAPNSLRVERRYSRVVCATCGTEASVSLH